MTEQKRSFVTLAWAALAGVVSGLVFLAAAEVLALVIAREASPVLAVGSFVVDVVPQPLKELAISTFGEYDKIALLAGLGLAVVIASAVAGVLQFVRPPLGVIALGVAGVLSIAAVLTRADAASFAFVPPAVGAIAGSVILVLLTRRLRAWRSPAAANTTREDAPAQNAGLDRRGFFLLAGIAGTTAVIAGIAARTASVAKSSVEALRRAVRLPAARTSVVVPAGAQLEIPGLPPLFTPNADFYRVDTALTLPTIDPATWRLVVHGMVEERIEIGFDELLAMGLDEYAITLTCVSNVVGGGLVGNATWLGVPVRDIIAKARPHADADMVLSRSVDGYSASTPLSALTDDSRDAIVAVGMNGEPLPQEHGFPVRMVVPGLYGYVSATKWLTELEVTTFAKDEAYWTPRGYSAEAPIKFSSRIDTPKSGKPVAAGKVVVAGFAWAQTVGIDRVEVRVDDGEWMPATLSVPVNEDTWVQWYFEWEGAEPGTHYVAVRATNRDGDLQVEETAPIAPDGSTGWHRILITVE